MRISVTVKPHSKAESVEKLHDKEFIVRVTASAQNGKANTALINLLSEYFDLPKSRITVIRGHKTKKKLIDILE